MKREEVRVTGPVRREPSAALSAARLQEVPDEPPGGEGVQSLNPGFFRLQRMRQRNEAKARDK